MEVPVTAPGPGEAQLSRALIAGGWLLPGAPPAQDPAGPPGEAFGPYVLVERLGSGGMGVVWKAWDPRLRRFVALKQVLPDEGDPGRVERFRRESRLAARLRHPHIAAVHDVGEHAGRAYFTCDWIDGVPFDRWEAGSAWETLAGRIESIAEALHYAHERDVVHRDVKPSNLLVDREGKAWVTDFGLAKDLSPATGSATSLPDLTTTGALCGTPQYMSPEQARGDHRRVGAASDQFSLGAVLYRSLTGAPPFGGASLLDLLRDIAERTPPAPDKARAGVPADLSAVCMRALEKDPARRYPSLGEMAADLYRFRHREPVRARARGPSGWWLALSRSRILPWAVLAALGIAAAAYGVAESGRRREEGVGRCLVLGNALLARGEAGLAEEAFRAALGLDPDCGPAREGLDRAVALTRSDGTAKAGGGLGGK